MKWKPGKEGGEEKPGQDNRKGTRKQYQGNERRPNYEKRQAGQENKKLQ